MNKLFRFFMFLSLPMLSVFAVSCDDDTVETTPAPTITNVSPPSGLPGTPVTITGTNLEDATVTFGTVAATVTSSTATSISTAVPATATAGSTQITVTTDGGADSFDFEVEEEEVAMTITSFDPTTGPVGETVTITGTNFDANNIFTIYMGDVEVTDYEVVDENTITFTVPDAAQTSTITINPMEGDPVVSADVFSVISDGPTVAEFRVQSYAQGMRNDGVPTAFNAYGETFLLEDGVDNGDQIDFISTDSGGDNELDLFSPSHTGWLEGNYFEDADDMPVEWSYRNTTRMMILPDVGEEYFNNADLETIQGLEFDESSLDDRIELSPEELGSVILFETERGDKGLLLYSNSDLAEGKDDMFTFDIKVIME